MQLIEDDAETNPHIPPSQLEYIRHLPDAHQQYTRFFDGLLVPRPSHAAYFRDLQGFRCLPTTIKALTLCDPEDFSISKEQRKENYRDVTRKYLGSRFAHPWCRKAVGGMGTTKMGGWWGAEWAATGKQMTPEQQAQEDKLHRLLIPIWINFRSKMFPGPDVVEAWWEQRQLANQAQQAHSPPVSSNDRDNLGTKKIGTRPTEASRAAESSSSWQKGWGDEDDDDDDDGDYGANTNDQGNAAATGLMRLAAAGMIVNSMSRMQKWKLKRELKKLNR